MYMINVYDSSAKIKLKYMKAAHGWVQILGSIGLVHTNVKSQIMVHKQYLKIMLTDCTKQEPNNS